MSENGGGEFILGFVIGALAGAAAALLLSPVSGEEARQQLVERSGEFKGQAQKLADEAKNRAQKLASEAQTQVKQLAEEARGQAEHVQERGRIVLSDNVKKAQQVVLDAQTKLGKADGTAA